MFDNYLGKYCVVRTEHAGVFTGILDDVDSNVARIKDVRRIWYWDGAATLSQLAMEGVKKPENCMFSMIVPEMEVFGVVELIPCTEEARKVIEGVPVWKI